LIEQGMILKVSKTRSFNNLPSSLKRVEPERFGVKGLDVLFVIESVEFGGLTHFF
jgi:hypothetical protein